MRTQQEFPAAVAGLRVAVYRDILALQRSIPAERIRPAGVLDEQDAGLRVLLLRAGAAWLIGWAGLLAILRWGL